MENVEGGVHLAITGGTLRPLDESIERIEIHSLFTHGVREVLQELGIATGSEDGGERRIDPLTIGSKYGVVERLRWRYVDSLVKATAETNTNPRGEGYAMLLSLPPRPAPRVGEGVSARAT
jgi:hypothetical protein